MIGAGAVDKKPEQTEEVEVDFFDWLMDQSWVKRIASSRGHTKISTKYKLTTEEAEQKLRDGGFGDKCSSCTFIEAVEREYEFSADRHDDNGVEIKSGDTIVTPKVSTQYEVNIAKFSGVIRLPVAGDFGISVAHLFRDAAGSAVYKPGRSANIGERKLMVFDPIFMKPLKKWRKISGDMCFLQMAQKVLLRNEVVISDQSYSLKLYRDDIQGDMPVTVFIRHGVVREGRIHDDTFCDFVDVATEQHKMYRMISIIAEDGSLRKVTEKGESGSLVMTKKAQDNENMYVIGIVSGIGKDKDGSSFTFANRLMDVLLAVGENEDLCLTLTDGKCNTIDINRAEFFHEIRP